MKFTTEFFFIKVIGFKYFGVLSNVPVLKIVLGVLLSSKTKFILEVN